jgi:hypothetical protein
MMLRRLALTALVLAVAMPAVAIAPASAEDDLVRQLVNACTGCRFPKDLHGRDLHGLHFTGANLRGVDFSRANLSGAAFIGADLTDARFDDADLRNARFTGVRFRNTSFVRAKTDGVEMEGVRLDARSIVGADYRTFIRGCTGCDLREMPLSNAERRVRSLSMSPPGLSPEVERELRNVERDMRAVEREMRLHPPVIPPELRRRLRELELHPPVIPPMPPLPPMPVTPVIPPMPPAPAP